MSLKKNRFALVVLTGLLVAILSSPLIVFGYPLFALILYSKFLVSVITMIIVNRIFIMKVKQSGIRVILQIALVALPIITNILIETYQLTFENPSWFQISADGDDKLERIVVWKEPTEMSVVKSGKKRMDVYQSGLYRDQSWFFIPGIALLQDYKKEGHLMLASNKVTEIEHDTINIRLFEKVSASLYRSDQGYSYYNNLRFIGSSYDTVLIQGKFIQFTILKFIPDKDTGCFSPNNDYRMNCINTGELQIGNYKSLGISREWIKQMLDSTLEK